MNANCHHSSEFEIVFWNRLETGRSMKWTWLVAGIFEEETFCCLGACLCLTEEVRPLLWVIYKAGERREEKIEM